MLWVRIVRKLSGEVDGKKEDGVGWGGEKQRGELW